MLYVLFFKALMALGVLGLLALIPRVRELAIMLGIVLGLFTGALGATCGISLLIHDSSTMEEYNISLQKAAPRFKGKYICEDTELTFKGVQSVIFEQDAQVYQVDFPTVESVSELTAYCSLNLKPDVNTVTRALDKIAAKRQVAVYHVLYERSLPSDIDLPKEDVAILQKMLNTPNLQKEVRVNRLIDSPIQNRLIAKDVGTNALIPVPKSARLHENLVDLSDQELLKNISAQ